MNKLFTFCCALVALTTLNSTAQDLNMLYKIRTEASANSAVGDFSYKIIDLAGPRLTGSDGGERGYDVALATMKEIGLENTKRQFARKWHRGGWENRHTYAAITAPYYMHVFPTIVGWTGSTNGFIKAPVVYIETTDSAQLVAKYAGKLKGKIVLMPSTQSYTMNFGLAATRRTEQDLEQTKLAPITVPAPPRARRYEEPFLTRFIRSQNPEAIIHENGNFNNPGITFYNHTQGNKPTIAELNVTLEIHGLMERLLSHGEKVEMELDIKNDFINDRDIYNIVGEIPGTDPKLKDQIVMIGAHLDSYHHSGGAGDDAAGCITMLEAMRILKVLDVKPRRTIRIVLWGGEEMGIHGSNGYVEQFIRDPKTGKKLSEYDKLSVYFNADYGPGRFRGIHTQGNVMVEPIFQKWLDPLASLECTTVSNQSPGSTDHVPFDAAGIPAFQFLCDNLEWGRGSHHATDFSDHLILADLRQNAVVAAWMAYLAAMSDEMIPRKIAK